MIRTDAWQAQAIEEMRAALVPSNDVLALALFGSALHTSDQLDAWSDLDLLLVVHDDAYARFYPTLEWLKPFGRVFACQQTEDAFRGTIRVCFADFRRFDIVVTTESSLSRLAEWPSVPFTQGVRLLFSRSASITHLLSQRWSLPHPTFPSQREFDAMVNDFWFKATLASYKVARNDLLIALHLALDLVRDCCVVGMMIRDRTKGITIHRDGGAGNRVVADLATACSTFTAAGIVDVIEQSSIQFDQLAGQWSEAYREQRYPLVEWLEHIRRAVSK